MSQSINQSKKQVIKPSGIQSVEASQNQLQNQPLYVLNNVCKTVNGPSGEIQILKSINFQVQQGESVAILGSSGSGKSTLLHALAGLDTVTSGEIFMIGKNMAHYTEVERAHLRNKDIGFVFQFHHLLPEFSTLENVAMQAIVGGVKRKEAIEKARTMLEIMGLQHREHNLVNTLSGGERQRVAIARAVLLSPQALLADEPTGNLDADTGERIVEKLIELNGKGMALVMVTHNNEIASRMGRIFELRSGELYEKNDI